MSLETIVHLWKIAFYVLGGALLVFGLLRLVRVPSTQGSVKKTWIPIYAGLVVITLPFCVSTSVGGACAPQLDNPQKIICQ